MRILKDPFTGDLLLSLDTFESKQVKDKGYVRISTKGNFFGYLKILYDDLSEIITEELINERLEGYGFGQKQEYDEALMEKSVLTRYGCNLIDTWPNRNMAQFFIYSETTSDGYEVHVATDDPDNINIGEHVHYYESDLGDELADAIKNNGGDAEFPDDIYVDDLNADYVREAIETVFEYTAFRLKEQVIDELLNEGYEHEDAEAVA